MSGFSVIERSIARMLGRAPALKRVLKRSYQIANYFLFAPNRFRYMASSGIVVQEASARQSTINVRDIEQFFGYFDKSPWSSDMRQLLLHRVNADGTVSLLRLIGEDEIVLGRTRSWSWQQGAMLQWIPDTELGVVYNTVKEGALVSLWQEQPGDKGEAVSWPVQAIAPSGKSFISLNYRRLAELRPDYGYTVEAVNFSPRMDDSEDGLWLVQRRTGQAELVLSLATLRGFDPTPDITEARAHKVNHVLYSPSGERFVFLYRWFGSVGKCSRLFVYDLETGALRLLMDDGMVSHYCWKDDETLIVYGRTKEHGDAYYQVDAVRCVVKPLGLGVLDKYGDGHPSVSPDGRWLLTDTYPDRKRQQRLLMYNLESGELHEIARFLSPLRFDSIQRVDLHPRWSPDGRKVAVDSAHEERRGLYIVDISELIECAADDRPI